MPKHAAKTESTRAAAAFDEYCAMGLGRGLRTLATHLKTLPGWRPPVPALNTLENWSAAYGWQERVREYDAAKAEERAAKRERQIEAMNRRHANASRKVFERMAERLVALAEIHEVGAHAAAVAMKNSADIERAARGVPQQVEVKATVEGSLTHDINLAADGEASALANAFLRRLTTLRASESGGPGVSGE